MGFLAYILLVAGVTEEKADVETVWLSIDQAMREMGLCV
jgi:hypothetical protein